MGPRVPRRPTSGLGRRLLRGSCAPSWRPAVLFPPGCSGFWRLRPLPPSCCLAASPRLPAGPVPRPGALVRLRPVAASYIRVCRRRPGGGVVCGRGTAPPALRRAPPRSGARARAWVGSRLSAVAVAAARCLRRWWGVSGSGPASPCSAGARAGPPRPRRGRPVPRPRPRAATGAGPGCVCGGGSDRPSPLRAAAGVPSSAVAGPGQSASLAVAGGVGPWRVGSVFPLPPAGPCAPWGWLPPPSPPRVPPRARHVRPTGRPCARAPPGGRGLSLAHRAPTWLILPVAYACLKD